MFVTTLLDFLVVGFIIVLLFPIHIPLIPYLNYISSILFIILVFDFALIDSNPSKFLHKYSFAFCKMVTFHATRRSDLTIIVDKSRMTVVFEHCFLRYVYFSTMFFTYI
jgi:hypothetical protein